jgi:hypothetical protein
MTNQYAPVARFTTQAPLGSEDAIPLENFAVLRDGNQQMIGFAVSENEVTVAPSALLYDAARHQLRLTAQGKCYFTDSQELPEDALRALHSCCESGLTLTIFSLPVIEDEEMASNEQTTHQG